MREWINLFENTEKLPMDRESRMKRATEQGFTQKAYHGTIHNFDAFDMSKGKANHSGFAPFFASTKGEAKGYADARADEADNKGKVLSVLLRIKKAFIVPDTWGAQPEDVEKTDEAVYKIVTGGVGPKDSKDRNRYLHNRDAIEHAMDLHYKETGNYDRHEIWTKIYSRLMSAGYDCLIWKDVRADYTEKHYDRIVMLDMSGIRLTSAAFDPAKQNSNNLKA